MYIPNKNFFSIGEVAKICGVKPHILRYWESEFKLLRPARRESGQRKYIRKDLEIIAHIKDLLYNQKYSIIGAKKVFLRKKREKEEQLSIDFGKDTAAISLLKDAKKELRELLKILK